MGNMLLRFSIKFPLNGPLAEQRLWRRLAFILCYLLFPFHTLFHQPLQTGAAPLRPATILHSSALSRPLLDL